MNEQPHTETKSFLFPQMPSSEYDRIKHHQFFSVICHICKHQFNDLYNFFDFAVNTKIELLESRLKMISGNFKKLEILNKEIEIINSFFIDKDGLRLYTDRLFLTVGEFDLKLNSEISALSSFQTFLIKEDNFIFDLGTDIFQYLSNLQTEYSNDKNALVDNKIKELDSLFLRIKKSTNILPELNEIDLPDLDTVQKMYYLVLLLGTKKLWINHINKTIAEINGHEINFKSKSKAKVVLNNKSVMEPIKFRKELSENLFKILHTYFEKSEEGELSKLLSGEKIDKKLNFKASGNILGFVFRELCEKRKIKKTKKDLMDWLKTNFFYFNSKTKLYASFTDEYLQRVMYHKNGIPAKANKIDIKELLS